MIRGLYRNVQNNDTDFDCRKDYFLFSFVACLALSRSELVLKNIFIVMRVGRLMLFEFLIFFLSNRICNRNFPFDKRKDEKSKTRKKTNKFSLDFHCDVINAHVIVVHVVSLPFFSFFFFLHLFYNVNVYIGGNIKQ